MACCAALPCLCIAGRGYCWCMLLRASTALPTGRWPCLLTLAATCQTGDPQACAAAFEKGFAFSDAVAFALAFDHVRRGALFAFMPWQVAAQT